MRQLTLEAGQLVELKRLLSRLVDAVAFNATVTLVLARNAGVEMPYGIDVVNDETKALRSKIDAVFEGVFDEED